MAVRMVERDVVIKERLQFGEVDMELTRKDRVVNI